MSPGPVQVGDATSPISCSGKPARLMTEEVGTVIALAESGTEAEVGSRTLARTRWWRAADFGVLASWIALVAFTLHYHEKWADEAQAWLIARDLSLRAIWFHELRYEGTPGLWHTILWIAQHVFHAGYGSIGLIGMAGATAGVALLIFKAPFPRYIRWPLAFTYVTVYQYAVIARPYTLFPLLAFAVAILFKDIEHPERMTVVLVLMANLCLHGTILAGCLGLVYLIEAGRAWGTLDARVRNRHWISIAIMVATFVFIVMILKPTPDIEEFVIKKEIAQLAPEARAHIPSIGKKLTAVISGAFFDHPLPSAFFIILSTAWSFLRRQGLAFALPTVTLIFFYAALHGAAHHHGTVFIAAVAGLWIAWPSSHEQQKFNDNERWLLRGMTLLLVCLCALNIWDASVAIYHEYRFPYSGSEDAAQYLKSLGADRGPMFGLLFGTVAVQAYFDHNIFTNLPNSYFHHGLPLIGTELDVEALRRITPEYVVAYSQEPEMMLESGVPQLTAEGYQIVHFSDGYYLYKRGVFEREVYFILRRSSFLASP